MSKNERLEELIQRGKDVLRKLLPDTSRCERDIESIIREAWLMGRSDCVDRPPFVEPERCNEEPTFTQDQVDSSYAEGWEKGFDAGLNRSDEITDEGDLP